MVDINFFKKIYNDDIIYHYTKASTAIDFILFNNQLRFNEARKSIDPIESKKARRGIVYYGELAEKPTTRSHSQDANELSVFVSNLEKRFNQICFCQNRMGEDFANENYFSNFKGHEEIFGFTKPRMWDQYADNFAGVCIAFSKKKILSLNKKKIELIHDNVDYLKFQELSARKIGDIQGNHLKKVGKEQYKLQLEQLLKESFFLKHIDYSGENEYRIGTIFDEKKCSVEVIRDEVIFNRTLMLDISGCIEAIFISSFANYKQKSDLLKYANNLNVEIIEMKWEHNSFEPRDYRAWIELVETVLKEKKDENE